MALPRVSSCYWRSMILRHSTKLPRSLRNHQTVRSITVWEPDKQSGYRTVRQATQTWRDVYNMENLKSTIEAYKRQFRMWKEEWVAWFYRDIEVLEDGDVKMIYDFRDPDPDKVNGWTVTADADFLHGRSWGKMDITQDYTCLFTGNLNHTPIADGWSDFAGYVNLRSPYKYKSFYREDAFNWTEFTHIVLRYRGDGRTYLLNINTRGCFDVSWNDLYSYPLYTRGGPYWQTERIPFSKFFFAHKGKIQDKQAPIDLTNVHGINITAGDGIDGPFKLEIDYIAIEIDESHTEEHAYELYEGRRFET
ncbi:complex I intermediate-associated protein 30, mitochondrial-like [Paramacrobiotus metropolitanus]|uniref:complex I intermediate-associated protein 30, mitochondrial-like n=1 Tax=Paramacrobiotus metropolitanus TaxID=2943436 RepID=UPI00244566EF|nr:complex I intermediate-associated protein 30, mitochondrial-like [Paramacrobiotus metropolitanus]XP_055354691.1 complex I intermediate-associated protein 30, mitochondrial-like [Paramacrobiotus metropolitanus]